MNANPRKISGELMTLTLILTVIVVALVFEYINAFHDTANSIATVVGTKVLTPRQAIVPAAVTNLVGALYGDAVAKTVTSGIVDSKMIAAGVAQHMLICALLGGIVWNLITSPYTASPLKPRRLPSSSWRATWACPFPPRTRSALPSWGCAKRFSALKLSVVERVIWAWVFTLPAAGGLAFLFIKLGRMMGVIPN